MNAFEGKWKGRFESDVYKLLFGFFTPVKGTVEVDTDNGKALLNYTGSYRNGDRTEMTLDMETLSGTQEGKAVGFKGHSLTTSQQVTFETTGTFRDMIEGTYLSHAPYDKGHFWLEKIKP